jgi:crossover junction endodeoxyribonuclease RuvC
VLILGLDPGSHHTGFGLLEAKKDRLEALRFGRFSCPARLELAGRLGHLSKELKELVERWRPGVAVLETPFHGLNSRSLVVLAQARGALLAVLATEGIAVAEYSPAEVKSAVTGNGRADKSQVARMVALHLSLGNQKLSSDAADALAVAICYCRRQRVERLVSEQTQAD